MSKAIICKHGLDYVNAHHLAVTTQLDLPFDSIRLETKLLDDQVNLKIVFVYQGSDMVEYPGIVLHRKNVDTTALIGGLTGSLPATVSVGGQDVSD